MKYAILLAALVGGCAAPAILGGPTRETTGTDCEGTGAWCPNGYVCTLNPKVPCEAADAPAPPWSPVPSGAKASDSGAD